MNSVEKTKKTHSQENNENEAENKTKTEPKSIFEKFTEKIKIFLENAE